MIDTSNYFAILPATVRYDKSLSARTVLLYAMLTSLATASGEAYASNKYIGDVLGISDPTVKRCLRELETGRYITVKYEFVPGTREIARRLIRINDLAPLLEVPKTQSLYAVVPSHILCDSELSPQAKLLYAEISAATPTDGYCSKPASYFAELMHSSEPTVRRWIKELQDRDAVRVEMEYKGSTREIRKRRIYLTVCSETVDRGAKIAPVGSKDVSTDGKPKEPNMPNSAENGRNSGMLIFDPTSQKPPRNKRGKRGKRGKRHERRVNRKKITDNLRL